MPDWFRKSSWNEADRADFEKRLGRARMSSRAQYLRIQAGHLAESGHHRDALDLLGRLLKDYDDPMQRAQAHIQRAQSCDAIGDVGSALEAYRTALRAESDFANVRTRVSFEFPLFVARHNLRHAFAEALSVLERSQKEMVFPQDRFEVASARSLIAAELGDADAAKA